MNPRTKRPVQGDFQGCTYPAGSEVAMLEPLDSARRVWVVEFTVPDTSLVGGARYETAELSVEDLDFSSELAEDMQAPIATPEALPVEEDNAFARAVSQWRNCLMYLAAQRVISPVSQKQAVNLFAYLHGPLAPGVFPNPDKDPGVAVWSDVRLTPPGNRVLSYLDVVFSDVMPVDQVLRYLSALKHMLQPTNGNPTIQGVGPLWVRFGLGHASIPWSTELGALAGHLVTRLPPRLG